MIDNRDVDGLMGKLVGLDLLAAVRRRRKASDAGLRVTDGQERLILATGVTSARALMTQGWTRYS
jgi:hypothetical protein